MDWGKYAKRRVRAVSLAVLVSTVCAAVVALAALVPTAAQAGTTPSGVTPPLALDAPQNGDDPLIAYDPVSATTYVAWSDNQAPDNGVELCILPADTTTCKGGGPILLSVSSLQNPFITGDNTISLGGLTVLPNGDVVVLGTPVSTGTVAWESEPYGSAFLSSGQGLQNGGTFISPVSLFYTFNNAVALSDTDVAILDDYGDYFSDSAFAGPESPALPNPNSNQGNGGLYPRKGYGATGAEIAAEAAPGAPTGTDIVVAVGDNYAGPNTTLPGCVNSSGTGYAVSVGSVNGGSNAPGTLNGEGIPGYGLLACSAEYPVVGSGGQAGIGVLEDEGNGISGAGSTYTLDYRPFHATSTGGSFGNPVQLAKMTDYADDLDLVEDAGTGVYAMWDENGLWVDYSPDGGAHWNAPILVPELSNSANPDDPVIAGLGEGEIELAFDNNLGTGDRTYVELIDANPITVPKTATVIGSTVKFSASCSAACGASLMIETKTGASAANASNKKTKSGPVTLTNTKKFSLTKAGKANLTFKLTSAGKSLLAKDHDKLVTTLVLSDNTARGVQLTDRYLKLIPKPKKK